MASFQRLKQVLAHCLELQDDERAAYLEDQCADSPELKQEIESILGAEADLPSLLATNGIERLLTWHTTTGGSVPGHLAVSPPATIGPYRVVDTLGEGGMGTVYLAEQTHPIQRTVAVKLIKSGMDTKSVISRFEAERQALAIMDHPNIAKVLDAGATDEGRPYFVMEYVRGETVTAYCDRERLDPSARLALFMAICGAIHHAHQKGILHRDIKPSNVLVTLLDGVPVPKVIDFGIAKATGQDILDHTTLTAVGQVIGTPEYMSPEQAGGAIEDIDASTDVYSLGVLLYELLTGTVPFQRSELQRAGQDGVRRWIREVDPPIPSRRVDNRGKEATETANRRRTSTAGLVRQIRGDLDWITMRALQEERARRYPSASEFAADIGRFLRHDVVEARPPSALYATRKLMRRHKAPFALAAVLFATLAGFGAWMAVLYGRAETSLQVSDAVTEFLSDMLTAAQPTELGRDVTVREVLDASAGSIGTEFGARPEVEARLRRAIGNTYESLGEYDTAGPHLKRSLELSATLHGDRNRQSIETAGDLAALYIAAGQHAEADSLLVRTMEAWEQAGNSGRLDLYRTMHRLGMLRQRQGRVAEAESLWTATLEGIGTLRDAGDSSAELALGVQTSMATLLQELGRLDESETLHHELLEARRGQFGADHPAVLNLLDNLAVLYQQQSRMVEAESLLVQIVGTQKRVLGDDHPNQLIACNSLATMWKKLGRYAEAESLHADTLDRMKRVFGPEHQYTLVSMNNLCSLYGKTGRLAEAESLGVVLLETRIRVLGPSHPDVLASQNNLAGVYSNTRQYAQAAELYEKVLTGLRALVGNDHPNVIATLSNIGDLHNKAGTPKQGEAFLLEAVEIADRTLPGPQIRRAMAHANLGRCLRHQKRYAESEPHMLDAHGVLAEVLGETHPTTIQMVGHVVALYEDWGRPESATEWKARIPSESK